MWAFTVWEALGCLSGGRGVLVQGWEGKEEDETETAVEDLTGCVMRRMK